MNLYFEHSNSSRELIYANPSSDKIINIIMKDLKMRAPRFKCYYIRQWEEERQHRKEKYFDVGDHCCFYVLAN